MTADTHRMKRPAFQWYPGDARRDVALQSCSFEARALWREMLDLMHDGAPRGYLTAGGCPIEPVQLARMVGESLSRVRKWLAELEGRKVFSRSEAGTIYSRRMVRDEETMVERGAHGKLGGSPKLGVEYNTPGFVYVMRRYPSGELKIGISVHPAKRLYRVRQQFPGQLVEIVATGKTENMGASEAALHQEFAAYGVGGEWFKMDENALGRLLIHLQGELKGNAKEVVPPAVAVASAVAVAVGKDGTGVTKQGAEDASPSLARLTFADLPPAAVRFGERFYAAAAPERRAHIAEQLLATLGEGAQLNGQARRVKAGTLARLEAKCREVMSSTVNKPDSAIVILLLKLSDTSDGSAPGHVAENTAKAERKRDERASAKDLLVAETWIQTEPDVSADLESACADLDPDPTHPLRKIMRRTLLLSRWTEAGSPVPPTDSGGGT